ncbi:hypothetical protein GRF59_05375 [Paenibacillus sp. HJL G12]|uniref:Prolipoprotein diacylglyceryl transferase n=1 Tax=Paenibacillus dendrobii TaxID=2691084 RepID=A0A7X3LHC3_9BACL|nr:hypothetical protein [Paenibacillus dendrobii]MWV43054.1 hypothetical protein [Paenibacillus dendrobii]
MQVIMIGPFMLRYSLIVMIIGVAAGYLVTLIRTRYLASDIRKPVLDELMTTLLIGILVWKFSTLVFDFKTVIRSPLTLLYYSGGTGGMILAIVIGILILAYKCIRYHKSWILYANAALTWLISGYGVISLLQVFLESGGVLSGGRVIVAAAMVLYLFRHKNHMESAYHLNVSLMWSAIGLFAASLLGERDDSYWFGFSGMQIFLLSLSLVTLIIKVFMEKRNMV